MRIPIILVLLTISFANEVTVNKHKAVEKIAEVKNSANNSNTIKSLEKIEKKEMFKT